MIRALWVLALLALSAPALAGEPLPWGPFSSSSIALTLFDSTRSRQVEVTLVFPAQDAPVPFVLFSPGFLLSATAYRSTGDLLASHGIAVALLTYDVSLFNAAHRVLADDLRFVLDRLPTEAAGHGIGLDGERVGLAGHSLGGKLSFLVAAGEPRVRAVAGLDPVDGGVPGVDDPVRFPRAADRMEEIAVPKLLIGAERGGDAQFGIPCAPRESNYERLFERTAATAWEVTQIGAGHMDYLDNPNCGFACAVCIPGANPALTLHGAQAYTLLFFRAHLLAHAQAAEALGRRLAEDEDVGLVRVRSR